MSVIQHALEVWAVRRKDHPGSSISEISSELDWSKRGNEHYTGYRNSRGIRPGLIDDNDRDHESCHDDLGSEKESTQRTTGKADSKKEQLMNWQDAINSEKKFSLYHPEGGAFGWRNVLDFTEDEIRNQQDWPANIEKRREEEQQQQQEEKKSGKKGQRKDERNGHQQQSDQDSRLQKQTGGDQDQCSEGDGQQASERQTKRSEYDRLRDSYSPQQIAFLRAVQHEKDYIANLKTNDGKGHSGMERSRIDTFIADDESTPDNWIPRSKGLIRLTGKHPLNAEPDLRRLFNAGFITPNDIHYVRSHGAVPRLLWEHHRLEVTPFGGKSTTLSMDEVKHNFNWINIPVFIGCDNGRRKELNMRKRTTGFNWGPAAAACAYWKGALLRDVLLAAGESEHMPDEGGKALWVHLQGADNPGAALYETSIPFEYVMDPKNDVMLAYEMNDMPLPPDHGYPIRTIVPGYVGGRHVKWLQKIWVTDRENESYYHIWDNRMVPSFVTSQDDEFGKAMFHHPDTALYEQYLNSIITRPSQGETISLGNISEGSLYRIEGFACNGRGDEIKRIEITLDGGKTWLYCIRRFPDAPLRHGRKYWTWCFWHLDVRTADLISVDAIRVRAWDTKMLTQPETPTWNLLGSMNNVQYIVKPEIVRKEVPHILFRHPVEAGNGQGGWLKDSAENRIADAEKKAGAPKTQFTRVEIEKHNQGGDCWIVVDGKVYDATSVMSWHPGGSAPIMMHAGAVHHATTEEFASVHDDYAYSKLNECVLGVVTDKAMHHIRKTKEEQGESDAKEPQDQALHKYRWTPATLTRRDWISEDTAVYTFALPDKEPYLGLETCQHVEFGFHLRDRMLIRPYTPTLPVLPRDSRVEVSKDQDAKELHDGSGTFQLTVKTYFPDDKQPGGALSNILAMLPIGEGIDMRGPWGGVVYRGRGNWSINGEEKSFKRVSLILGGTGLTPGYSLIARVALDTQDRTEVRVVNANKSEPDILLRAELERFVKLSEGRVQVTHVLDSPSDEWDGQKGHVNEQIVKECLFPPQGDENLALLCGPPPMIQKAALPALEDWGYDQQRNMFGL